MSESQVRPRSAFTPEAIETVAPVKRQRPELVPITQCPLCGDILPNHDAICYGCLIQENTERKAGAMGMDAVKALHAQSQQAYRALVSRFQNPLDEGVGIPLPESEPLQELSYQKDTDEVDVLPAPRWQPWMTETVLGISTQVINRDVRRRGVVIANLGKPLIGSAAAIAAADLWLGTRQGITFGCSDGWYLPANTTLTIPTTDTLWAIDNGTSKSVIYAASTYVR